MKTKQDRAIVTVEHYTAVGTADFLQHSDPPQTPAWGDIPSNKNFSILIQPPI